MLAATDASAEARAALLVASDVCRVTGARLEVAYVWREPQQAEYYSETIPLPVHGAFLREARGVLTREVTFLRGSDARVAASHLRYGDPVTEIVRLATELEPGTIVIGSRTHGVIRRLAMGSVVEQLAARSITPVLVVQKAASSWPPTSVALVLDQTASSHAVFMTAALFAARYRIKVRLIAGTGGPSPDLVWARHRVEQMQARVRTDVKLERVVPDGGLENCLLRLAAAGALIATGSPAGGLWHRVVSQSLPLKLLRHCPGSLLIVPAA